MISAGPFSAHLNLACGTVGSNCTSQFALPYSTAQFGIPTTHQQAPLMDGPREWCTFLLKFQKCYLISLANQVGAVVSFNDVHHQYSPHSDPFYAQASLARTQRQLEMSRGAPYTSPYIDAQPGFTTPPQQTSSPTDSSSGERCTLQFA